MSTQKNDKYTPLSSTLSRGPSPSEVIESNLSSKNLVQIPEEEITLSAHDIRTVLTVMRNYLWVSTYQNEEPLGPKVSRNLSVVSYALDYLVMLVENTLAVNRLEKSEMKLIKEELDLIVLVNDTLSEYSQKAKTAGVRLVFEPSIQKAMVSVDRQKIKDVFGRLIENALKFTPTQGKVSFKVVESDDENNYEIKISDTGPGIPRHMQDALFTKFGKIEESYANVIGKDGAGLGLYIAKKYVEMHNGKISVASDAGVGCTFVVSLPKVDGSRQLSVDSQKGQ